MSAFKTGRERTLTIGGSFSMDTAAIMPSQFYMCYVTEGWLNIFAGDHAIFMSYPKTGAVGSTQSLNEAFCDMSITVTNGISTRQDQQTWWMDYAIGGSGHAINEQHDWAGSFAFSIDVEEWCEPYQLDPDLTTVIDGTAFPSFAGAATGDGLPATGVRFYELPRPGGDCVAQLVCPLGTYTCADTVPEGYYPQNGLPYVTSMAGHCYAQDAHTPAFSVPNRPSHVRATCRALGEPWGIPDAYYTNYYTTGPWASRADLRSGLDLNVNMDLDGLDALPTTEMYCDGAGSWQPPTKFAYKGRLRLADGSDYQGSARFGLLRRAGDVVEESGTDPTDSWDQHLYGCQIDANFLVGGVGVNELSPIRTWLNPHGDDSRDWRVQMRGFRWDALSVARSTTQTLDACTSASAWTAGGHTTVVAANGGITATASGGAGSVTLNVPHSLRVWELWRHLKLTMRAIAPSGGNGSGVSVNIGAGGSWSKRVGLTATDVVVDLCCSSSESVTVEPKSTRFPIIDPGGYPTISDPKTQRALGWGVDFCDAVTIGGIPDGWALVITSVQLTLDQTAPHTSLTLQEPFTGFQEAWTSDTDKTTLQPYALIETDYRITDMPALAHVAPTNGASPSYRWYSIGELAGMLRYLGLSVGDLPSPTDGYHDAGLWALLLGGSGHTFDYAPNVLGWTDWIGKDLKGNRYTVPAQDLWDEVQIYPQAGEVWTAGKYGGATQLAAAKALRGIGNGLVFHNDGSIWPGAHVNVFKTDAPTDVIAELITDLVQGEYASSEAGGIGNVRYTTELHEGAAIPYPNHDSVWQNRLRARVAFRKASVRRGAISYDVARSGRHAVAYVKRKGDGTSVAAIRVASNAEPQNFAEHETPIACKSLCLRWLKGHSHTLALMYVGADDGVYVAYSDDEGMSWSVPTAIATSGSTPAFVVANHGTRYLYWLDGGGSTVRVKGQIRSATDDVIEPTFTVADGVDDAGLAVDESVGQQGTHRIVLVVSQGGSLAQLTSRNGRDFS